MAKFTQSDEDFMRQVFRLALKGWGEVAPNPLVGAILVKNGKVMSEGYHHRYRGPHAEVEAISKIPGKTRGSTLYLNLEPCNHYGHTPPCTEAIISAGIKKVYFSNKDINPRVKGNGAEKLKRAGIETHYGLLAKEGRILNEIYFKNKSTGLPFVTIKAALSLDGFIYSKGYGERYLSGPQFLKYVHWLRAGYDAVIIGANTAMVDNPGLDVRRVKGRNPARIILSDGEPIRSDLKIFSTASKTRTIMAVAGNNIKGDWGNNIEVWPFKSRDGKIVIKEFLEKAGEEGITSILVEGGAEVFNSFIEELAFDKLIVEHSPSIFREGVPFSKRNSSGKNMKAIKFRDSNWERMGNDSVFTGYPIFD